MGRSLLRAIRILIIILKTKKTITMKIMRVQFTLKWYNDPSHMLVGFAAIIAEKGRRQKLTESSHYSTSLLA